MPCTANYKSCVLFHGARIIHGDPLTLLQHMVLLLVSYLCQLGVFVTFS